ncbi:hypothetical protein NUKP23_52630 [Klebsiella variicola]|nr:hypothetical protein NUKP23_52630 [Klebsiella variicola]
MMYQRTDLTLSMFYASSADADGNKVATLTMQVIAAEVGAVQTSQLRCITDSAKKKTYSVGEQSVSNGSDPSPRHELVYFQHRRPVPSRK